MGQKNPNAYILRFTVRVRGFWILLEIFQEDSFIGSSTSHRYPVILRIPGFQIISSFRNGTMIPWNHHPWRPPTHRSLLLPKRHFRWPIQHGMRHQRSSGLGSRFCDPIGLTKKKGVGPETGFNICYRNLHTQKIVNKRVLESQDTLHISYMYCMYIYIYMINDIIYPTHE